MSNDKIGDIDNKQFTLRPEENDPPTPLNVIFAQAHDTIEVAGVDSRYIHDKPWFERHP